MSLGFTENSDINEYRTVGGIIKSKEWCMFIDVDGRDFGLMDAYPDPIGSAYAAAAATRLRAAGSRPW